MVFGSRFGNVQASLPFVPTDIAGCCLWLDGADVSAGGIEPNNGDPVTLWIDKSTQGNNMSAGGNAPTYVTPYQNGLGAPTFNHSNQYMNGGVIGFASGSQGRTEFYVIQPDNTTPYNAVFSPSIDGGSGANQKWLLYSYSDLLLVTNGGGDQTSGGVISASTPYYICVDYQNGTFIDVGMTIYLNGTAPAQSANMVIPATALDAHSHLGVDTDDASSFFGGGIMEVILYNTQLTSGDRARVSNYIATKWAI